MAIEIRDKINTYLKTELKVELDLEKINITHISKGIEILGYIFSRKQIFIKQFYKGKIRIRKMIISTLNVNMKRIITLLSEAKFCLNDGTPIPAFQFLRLSQSEINVKVNYILRSLSECWSIADNRRKAIARVAYIIRYSIAKVYAAKFKLKTVSAVFKIGGNDLSKPIGVRLKSVVGADKENIIKGKRKTKKLTGILFDQYHKIPKFKDNKLKNQGMSEYLNILNKKDSLKEFIKRMCFK
jgi:hypothetical protein